MKFVTHTKHVAPTTTLGTAYQDFVNARVALQSTALALPTAPKGRLGMLIGNTIIDVELASLHYAYQHDINKTKTLPSDIMLFLVMGDEALATAMTLYK